MPTATAFMCYNKNALTKADHQHKHVPIKPLVTQTHILVSPFFFYFDDRNPFKAKERKKEIFTQLKQLVLW